jgi:hypothetical protein
MALNLIKLCVGVDTVEELAAWQKERLADMKKKGKKPELFHMTSQTPKRREELLDGGSLYWVVKGQIAVRQKLIDIREGKKRDGTPACMLVYDKKLVGVRRRAHRPFQGWRYLTATDAPIDLDLKSGAKDLPEALAAELASLGLL